MLVRYSNDSVIYITKWAQEYFQKPLSVNNALCHLQMPTKALLCKKEAICEHGPEVPSCPVDQGSFKMDCFNMFYGQTSPNLTFLFDHGCRVLRAKDKETFWCVISVQFRSQHL